VLFFQYPSPFMTPKHIPCPGRASARVSGFTLIELLTVIAIIGILAAIIIPTVSKVRSTAKAVQCSSIVRNWSQAMLTYATENKSTYFIYGRISGRDGSAPTERWWFQVGGANAIYSPYFTSKSNDYTSFEGCPTETLNVGTSSLNRNCFIPILPSLRGATANASAVPINRSTTPSRTILIMERPFQSEGSGTTSSIGTYGMCLSGLGADAAKFADFQNFTRHGGSGFNAAFLDGSLRRLQWNNGDPTVSLGMRIGPNFNYTRWTTLDQ
jgi:prepilin-type N-terminal cleavage/methylation domain-containing protein/prepilin-type processing-associated H-X9-DG protein